MNATCGRKMGANAARNESNRYSVVEKKTTTRWPMMLADDDDGNAPKWRPKYYAKLKSGGALRYNTQYAALLFGRDWGNVRKSRRHGTTSESESEHIRIILELNGCEQQSDFC